ncbi:MAG: amidohydrolase family protein [Cyclobacteriaceae bacterium]
MNTRLILTFALAIIFSSCTNTTNEESKDPVMVFKAVNVIPMDSETVLPNQDVVVSGGQVIALGESGTVEFSQEASVIDASGKYLMPGLAEMHAHVPPVDDMEPMKEVLSLFLANGITTIRGMLGHPKHLELRAQINSGEVLGPHFYTTGPSFNGSTVKTAEEGAQRVRDQKQAGYDYLKLHPGLTPETFGAVATTANEVGIPFVGHVSFAVGIDRAIDAGYSSIDHLDGFVEALVPNIEKVGEEGNGLFGIFSSEMADTSRMPMIIQRLHDNNIWMVPTQALAERWMSPVPAEDFLQAPEMKYMDQTTLDNWRARKNELLTDPRFDAEKVLRFIELRRKMIYECQRNGVGLLLGSDGPQIFNVPGFSVHHELKYLVDSGLTPFEALQSGTVNVAKYLGKENTGVVKIGAVSDLVLLNANPLEDIQNSTKIEGVMLGTNYLSKEDIASMLKGLEKSSSN